MYIHVDNEWFHIQIFFRGDSETFLYLGQGGVSYLNEIVVDDEDNDKDHADGRRIIPIALGLSAGGLKM